MRLNAILRTGMQISKKMVQAGEKFFNLPQISSQFGRDWVRIEGCNHTWSPLGSLYCNNSMTIPLLSACSPPITGRHPGVIKVNDKPLYLGLININTSLTHP